MKKIIVGIVLVIIAAFVLPWSRINWGMFSTEPAQTVTVSGEATSQQANQIASFSAGVMANNLDKNKAMDEVNTKVAALIAAVKNFGVSADDIKTQNLSYYQNPNDKGVQNPGEWQVNNTIEITLRDVTKASDLSDLLAQSGATNVYGPNFQLDVNNKSANDLFGAAVNDAKTKAANIAKASGRTLGKVLNVTEGGSSTGIVPMYQGLGMGVAKSAAPVEPGTQTVSQSVTVTFELK